MKKEKGKEAEVEVVEREGKDNGRRMRRRRREEEVEEEKKQMNSSRTCSKSIE
jgi:hypothetical protein